MRLVLQKLIATLFFTYISIAAMADDDEMTTETKPMSTPIAPAGPVMAPPGLPGSAAVAPKRAKPLDPRLRAQVRKLAPFWIDDEAHGASIRINKDGTLTSAADGGGSTSGTWLAVKGGLEIKPSESGVSYLYPATVKGGKLLINGRSLKNNRLNLN